MVAGSELRIEPVERPIERTISGQRECSAAARGSIRCGSSKTIEWE
jgi:hypothetical protein